MKPIWLTAKNLIGKYNLPSTVQGLTKRARNENWQKRKAKGIKGGGYEYEVSDIINKYKLLQNYDKDSGNKLKESPTDHDDDDRYERIVVDDVFLKNYMLLGDLGVEIGDNGDLKITTNGVARFILSKEFIEQQGLSNTQLATFTATDDSMSNTINNGDALMVSVYNEAEHQRPLDGIYVILFNDVLMIKRLQYNPVNASYNVISDNKQYQAFSVTPKDEPTFKVIAKIERVITKK